MKKLIAFLVAFSLLLTCFSSLLFINVSAKPAVSPATLSLREAFIADKKGEFEMADDGYIGIPVVLTTFVRESSELNKAVILYVVGTNTERVGTDSDEEIVGDLLNQGYIVIVADYLNNPLATGTPLSYSLMYLQSGNVNSGVYNCGYQMETMTSYCLPAGYRIERDIYFYSLDTMALNGTNEYIVWLWNEFYAGENGIKKDAQGNDLPYAETIYDCIKKDGSPMYFDLDMDIIYPANPSADTVIPVMAHASNCETRVRHISRNDSSTVYHIQGLLEGYASVVYDHEYIPMSRNDHYGYYGNYTLPHSTFTLAYTNANAVHSAAIRRIKYLADTYGYNAEYIGVTGFSKSSLGPAILADTTHEQRGEMKNFADYCKDGVDPDAYMGEQPWLTYDDGTRISSNVTVVYSGSGPGVCNYGMYNVTDNCVPFASTIGTEDTTGSFKTYIDRVYGYFDSHDIESLYYNPVGLAHFVAWGYNNEFQRENVDIVWSFLDNHVRAAYRDEAPEVLYMTPKSGVLYEDPQNITLKFSRAMDYESVVNSVKIIRVSDGKEISGSWSTMHGNTTFSFVSSQILNGDSYRVTVPAGTVAQDGVGTDMDFIKAFSIEGDLLLEAAADTFVSSLHADANFGKAENMAVSLTGDGEEIGLISFNRSVGFSDTAKARLIIDKTDGKRGAVAVYAKNGSFDENAVTYNDINKDDYTLLGFASDDGNTVSFDVGEFLKGNNSSSVTFMITAPFKEGETYSRDFENDDAATFKLNTHYAYGAGSATMNFVDGTVYLTGRSSGNRLKLIDGLGKSALEQSDLGVMYKITARVMAEEDANVLIGLYAQSGTVGYNPYGNATYFVKAGEWTTLEHYVTITQTMIDNNTDCVTFVPSGTVNYSIDQISVTVSGSGGSFATKENADKLTIPATLALWTPEEYVKEGSLAVIGSGKDKNTVLSEEITVNADGEEDCSATKKGYIKVPLSQFDASADTINFEFNLEEAVNNKISIYGLLDDSTKFAEKFDGNITWNTAYANKGNAVDKTKVFGAGPIATVSAANAKISVDVKDYVTYMKNKGYTAVTFMLVAQSGDTVKNVDFEGLAFYEKIAKSAELKNYGHCVKVDPTDADNSAFYFEKSGSTSPNGYQQTLSFIGLIDEDDRFTSEDIGSQITVTYRQYNVVSSEHADCLDFGKIGKAGTSTASLANLSFVTKTFTQNGKPISMTAPMNQWYEVKYVINVTEEAVKSFAEHNAIVISTGWTASGVYIDDIVVTKTVKDIVITSAEDYAPVALTDFENGSFEGYSANSYMNGYEIAVQNDPTAQNNKVLYIQKSGVSGSGYHQNVALTNLIKKNGVFTADDIGNVYTVTFRQYNSVSAEHADCMDFGNIGAVGTATSAIKKLPFVTKTTTYNGNTVSGNGIPMNDWYDVKYTVTVTEEAVASYSNATAIILAIGWTGNGIYIDDIKIDVVYGEKEMVLDFVPTTNFNGFECFENAVPNSWYNKFSHENGITKDPTDSTNDVYFFDKSGSDSSNGSNSYLENMAITGLIKTDNVFAESDIGRVYTVKYRQYNVVPEGVAECKDFSVIGVPGTTGTITSGNYQNPSFVTSKKCYYNGVVVSGTNIPMNAWYEVEFKFTVTEEAVAAYSNYTSILIGCGMPATRCYIDDIKVQIEGVKVPLGSLPGIVYDDTFKDDMTAGAVIDAAAPDKNCKTSDTLTLHRTAKASTDGIRKVYATFDKEGLNVIMSGKLNITVSSPTAGNTLYIYALNNSVSTEGLTWNGAMGNDDNNKIVTSLCYGGAPLAQIVLTDDTVYEIDITDYLKTIEKSSSFTVILTGKEGEGATAISSVGATLAISDYSDTSTLAVIVSPKNAAMVDSCVKISANSLYGVDKTIKKTEFYLDGALFEGYVQETGDIRFIETDLTEGEHTVYVVFTYSDSSTCRSDTVTFTVAGVQWINGDVDGDGTVNTSDLAALKLYLAGEMDGIGKGADMDNNANVDTGDLAALKLKLSGM